MWPVLSWTATALVLVARRLPRGQVFLMAEHLSFRDVLWCIVTRNVMNIDCTVWCVPGVVQHGGTGRVVDGMCVCGAGRNCPP